VPELILDIHRSRIPIDHPDRAVTRAKLEYPTVDVSFAYLATIDQVLYCARSAVGCFMTRGSLADKAVFGACQVNAIPEMAGRVVTGCPGSGILLLQDRRSRSAPARRSAS